MAQIDASALSFGFTAMVGTTIRHQAIESSSSSHYTWVTESAAPFFRITAFSFGGGITASPLGGTIRSINVVNDVYSTGFSITGLAVPLADLIDVTEQSIHFQKFWEQVLTGSTTVILPETGNRFSVMGDYVTVDTGQTLAGAADAFIGSQTASTDWLTGDALAVASGATLAGGADTFTDVFGTTLTGDVGNVSIGATSNFGTVNGGADRFSLVDAGYTPTMLLGSLFGDVHISGANSIVNGGDDSVTIRNASLIGTIVGDTFYTLDSTSNGGDDVILIETTIAGRQFVDANLVIGDDYIVAGAAQVSTGGNDSIILTNANVGVVSGDYGEITNGSITGGDDQITLSGTFAQTTPAAGYELTPTTQDLVGDARFINGATIFTGGDDTISLTRVIAPTISGDALSSNSANEFTGGDDLISVLFNRSDIAAPGFYIVGDLQGSASSDFVGGADTIALNTAGAAGGGSFLLVGDTNTSTFVGPSFAANGDDVIRLTSKASQTAVIYGDSRLYSGNASLTLTDGDDTITGGGGGDLIFADTAGVTFSGFLTYVGGADLIDGRGGNDTIFGGEGSDTVVFGLNQSVHVNLNGVAGSTGSDLYEAIGQGSDQLTGVENVTGSALGDLIIGDAQFNVLTGLGGADSLDGGGGQDTASYAGSNAGVVVNLSTSVTSGGHAQGDALISIERLTGSSFADTFVGSSVANVLDGGLGADSLRGLGGSDIYVVDNAGDVVDEAFSGSGGTDVVRASVSVSLSNAALFKGDVENVTLLAGVGLNAVGNALDNTITGNTTGNVLGGGLGDDTLTGGGGADRFLFNTALNAATNLDRITDFALDDRIDLDDAIFTLLAGPGVLTAAQFKNTAAGAIDANDRIIYNSGTGALFYDTNGSGAGGSTQFAQLGTGLGLTNADFLVF